MSDVCVLIGMLSLKIKRNIILQEGNYASDIST